MSDFSSNQIITATNLNDLKKELKNSTDSLISLVGDSSKQGTSGKEVYKDDLHNTHDDNPNSCRLHIQDDVPSD